MRLHLVQNIHPLHLTEKCVRILMKSNSSEENFSKKIHPPSTHQNSRNSTKTRKKPIDKLCERQLVFCNVFKLKSCLMTKM